MQHSPATSALSPSESPAILTSFLTSDEALFYACLENLTAQRCHIQCKPRLSEILQDESVAGFLKICQRHVDFIIYRKEDWMPMVAIEFEDDSPGKTSRKPRDRQLANDIFLTLGIPLLRVHAKEITQMDTLVHKLTAAWQHRKIYLDSSPPPASEPRPEPPTKPLAINSATTRLTRAA
ncbi:MAG: topoisomerase binding zinc finger domain protein [Prosthecobacter sp.]|nr:topoisomerase binding zinc finger domain protein [Prosthecobacter sp.]